MDMVSPDEAVRDAAGEARVAITGIKRAFFADETVYNAVAPVLKVKACPDANQENLLGLF